MADVHVAGGEFASPSKVSPCSEHALGDGVKMCASSRRRSLASGAPTGGNPGTGGTGLPLGTGELGMYSRGARSLEGMLPGTLSDDGVAAVALQSDPPDDVIPGGVVGAASAAERSEACEEGSGDGCTTVGTDVSDGRLRPNAAAGAPFISSQSKLRAGPGSVGDDDGWGTKACKRVLLYSFPRACGLWGKEYTSPPHSSVGASRVVCLRMVGRAELETRRAGSDVADEGTGKGGTC
jgi:hypothetical protein